MRHVEKGPSKFFYTYSLLKLEWNRIAAKLFPVRNNLFLYAIKKINPEYNDKFWNNRNYNDLVWEQ